LVDADIKLAKRGQLFALMVSVLGFGVSGFLGYVGSNVASAVIGGGTLVGIVSVFILGRKIKDQKNSS